RPPRIESVRLFPDLSRSIRTRAAPARRELSPACGMIAKEFVAIVLVDRVFHLARDPLPTDHPVGEQPADLRLGQRGKTQESHHRPHRWRSPSPPDFRLHPCLASRIAGGAALENQFPARPQLKSIVVVRSGEPDLGLKGKWRNWLTERIH